MSIVTVTGPGPSTPSRVADDCPALATATAPAPSEEHDGGRDEGDQSVRRVVERS